MSPVGTLEDGRPGLPVRAVSVEVLSGPDAGQRRTAEREKLSVGSADGNELVLTDPAVSRFHLELRPGRGGIQVVDLKSTNGTFAGGLRLERALVPPGTVLAIGDTTLRLGDGASITLELGDAPGGMVGKTPAMRRLMAQVARAAASEAPVLVLGESGTGKELIARAIHDQSRRRGGVFVTVDCGALTPTLVASDLFGHERGSFTGADRQHAGAFERADGGTIFLDEIGELPPALQAMLLGVLERKRLRRLGGREDLAVDVRIVCATNRDLRAEVNSGGFRLDLYYRIAVATLEVVPLRERADDVPLLLEHFLREAGLTGPLEDWFSSAAQQALAAHHWPGNVRELKNLVEATLAMGEPPTVAGREGAQPGPEPLAPLLELPYKEARAALLAEFERTYLSALLARCQGNVSRAAREGRIDRSHLIDLLARHRLRGE